MGGTVGLFDLFAKKRPDAADGGERPVKAESEPGILCSPVDGNPIYLRDVPDEVFGSGSMGKGCGIEPEGEVLYAPLAGEVSVVRPYAIGIKGADGPEVFCHVGLDTVDMDGDGFETLVTKGQGVAAGQALARFDRLVIAEAGHPDVVVLVVTNSADYKKVKLIAEAEEYLEAGEQLLRYEA